MRQKGEGQKSKLKKKSRRRSSSEKRAGPVQLSKVRLNENLASYPGLSLIAFFAAMAKKTVMEGLGTRLMRASVKSSVATFPTTL